MEHASKNMTLHVDVSLDELLQRMHFQEAEKANEGQRFLER